MKKRKKKMIKKTKNNRKNKKKNKKMMMTMTNNINNNISLPDLPGFAHRHEVMMEWEMSTQHMRRKMADLAGTQSGRSAS